MVNSISAFFLIVLSIISIMKKTWKQFNKRKIWFTVNNMNKWKGIEKNVRIYVGNTSSQLLCEHHSLDWSVSGCVYIWRVFWSQAYSSVQTNNCFSHSLRALNINSILWFNFNKWKAEQIFWKWFFFHETGISDLEIICNQYIYIHRLLCSL